MAHLDSHQSQSPKCSYFHLPQMVADTADEVNHIGFDIVLQKGEFYIHSLTLQVSPTQSHGLRAAPLHS